MKDCHINIFWSDEDGGYIADIPDLEACSAFGATPAGSRDVLDKVGEYLQAGVPLVWGIDPKGRTAAVYRSMTDVRWLAADDVLDGEDVVPGFRCRLGDVID